MATDWRQRSAGDLGRAIGAGEIDPRELADAFLDAARAHADGPRIYARLTEERARAEAAAAAERARAGRRLGPLDGVPISWKDLFDTAGTPTEAGSKLLLGRVPDVDAAVVHRASAEAGLVCLGKTHLSELAFSGLGVNPVTATPPNALDPDRAPGGSSSGAAVSVALGLAAAAVGSDTGGSVRIPAAWNDLVGLKTTHGLIPMDGAVPLARSLDTAGPLTRTVEDAALMLAALTGDEPVETADADPGAERFVVATGTVRDDCEADVGRGFGAALDRLGRAGAALAEAPVPEFAEAFRVAAEISAIVNTEGWREWGPLIEAEPGTMFPLIEQRFRSGMSGTAEKDAEARAEYRRLAGAVGRRIADAGPILLPATACTPPRVADLLADDDLYVERNLMALRNSRLANLMNLTALTVPSGSPMVGLMLFGRPGEEGRLLRAGRAIERALGG